MRRVMAGAAGGGPGRLKRKISAQDHVRGRLHVLAHLTGVIVHDRYRNYDSSELGAHNNIRCAASTDRAESHPGAATPAAQTRYGPGQIQTELRGLIHAPTSPYLRTFSPRPRFARLQNGGKWVDIDLALQPSSGQDGAVVAKAHPRGLRLAGGGGTPLSSFAELKKARGGRELVTLRSGDEQVQLQWRGGLPKPVLQGHRATYQDAIDGSADLVVEATRTGFEQFVRLKKPPGDSGYSYTSR
jgi:hypothetical protein